MSVYEIDSAYVRRCQKRLQEWGAPLSGWYCEYIYDVADEDNKGGNRYSVYVDGRTAWSYKGKPLDNFVLAAYAAFELADPIERIRP